jgi:hypothetical protein
MPYYSASSGLAVATSAEPSVFYPLTDHNRQPITIDFEVIEKVNRMADGTMRKFVVARKRKVNVSWSQLVSGTEKPYYPLKGTTPASSAWGGATMTADGYKGGAWMKSFYEQNVFSPIKLRVTHSQDTASANTASAFYPSPSSSGETFDCYITSFSYDISKRYTLTDLVDIKMEFTEI